MRRLSVLSRRRRQIVAHILEHRPPRRTIDLAHAVRTLLRLRRARASLARDICELVFDLVHALELRLVLLRQRIELLLQLTDDLLLGERLGRAHNIGLSPRGGEVGAAIADEAGDANGGLLGPQHPGGLSFDLCAAQPVRSSILEPHEHCFAI
eukprot:2708491-Prymnesium_polylepis.1